MPGPDFGPDEGLLDLLLSCSPEDFVGWVEDTKQPPAEVERLLWWMEHWADYRERPVSLREFVDSREYLDAGDFYYPAVKAAAAEIVEGDYVEAVLTGSIGAAKTHCANLVSTYELYSLLCMRSPHATFGLDPTSEIVLVVQSLGEKQAEVPYRQMKRRVETAPVFRRREFRHDPDLKSRMQFHGGVVVSPMTGELTSTVGQNVIGGLLDEVGNMSVVQRSLRTRDQSAYDQARMLYESLSRRRKSRFLSKGKLPGMLCLAGSRVHPGDFLHNKLEEARKPGSRIYVYDKRTWDVRPWDFGKERFRVFVGDLNRKPRVVPDAEEVPEAEAHLVVEVPVELRSEFDADIVGAVRDVAGYSASSRHPFLMDVEAVARSFGKVASASSLEVVDFRHSVPKLFPKRWEASSRHPRAAHLDLALSGDNAGLVIGHVPRFVVVKRAGGVQEYLPVIRLDILMAVQPPRGGEIPLERITDLLCAARQHGMPLKWVTADGFQSASSLQVLSSRGFLTGLESADKMPQHAYAVLKRALYDGRVELPFHALCQAELLGLEVDPKKGHVDHPVGGSKDVADALACVVLQLSMQVEVWLHHGLTPADVPSSLAEASSGDRKRAVEGRM